MRASRFRHITQWCRVVVVLALSLSMAACDFGGSSGGGSGGGGSSGGGSSSSSGGSGSGGDGEVQRGVFAGGLFNGLRYETETQSGHTNIDGNFLFREGETVRFSLGSIDFGSAPAQTYLSPFDLLGSEPVTEEGLLRGILEARSRVDDLDRVSNMTMLLMSLDSDRNPWNGVNLTDWDERIEGQAVDFDIDLYAFPDREGVDSLLALHRVYGVGYEIALSTPLVLLYEALGLDVSIHQPIRETQDIGENGILDFEVLFEYNDAGLLADKRTYQNPGTGSFWDHFARYEYDDFMRQVFFQEDSDTNEDSIIDSFYRQQITYDNRGLLSERLYEYGSVVVDRRYRSIYHYSPGGVLVAMDTERDNDADGVVDFLHRMERQYDDRGLITETLLESDRDADGHLEQRARTVYFYNGAGLLVREVVTLDSYDDTVDGITDFRIESEFEYDSEQRLILKYQETDNDNNGTVDSVLEIRNQYNARGLLGQQTIETGSGANGSVDFRQTTEYEYTASERVARKVARFESDRSTYTEAIDITENLYNDFGQLAWSESVRRELDSNRLISYHLEEWTFGDDGEPLTRRTEYQGDGGMLEGPVLWRWQYQLADNGLSNLIDHYQAWGIRDPAYYMCPPAVTYGGCHVVGIGVGVGGGVISPAAAAFGQ